LFYFSMSKIVVDRIYGLICSQDRIRTCIFGVFFSQGFLHVIHPSWLPTLCYPI